MRTVSTILALVLFGTAAGADKPAIDPAVAAAWGFTATPAVVVRPPSKPEAMPSYRLYQDSKGVWWSVPVDTPAPEVAAPVRPFQGYQDTPATLAPSAAVVSTASAGAVQYPALTRTLAPRGTRGITSAPCLTG